MPFFLASKMEKALKKVLQDHPELEIQYKDGSNVTISRLLKVTKDFITILGFPGTARQSQLMVKLLHSRQAFLTTVVRSGRDTQGRNVFVCKIPDKFMPNLEEGIHRYIVFPEGTVRLLVNTNRGERGITLNIWDFGNFGLTLINKTNVEFKIGTKIFQAMMQIQKMSSVLVDMQIVNIHTHEEGEKEYPLLECNFRGTPRNLEEMLSLSKKMHRAQSKSL